MPYAMLCAILIPVISFGGMLFIGLVVFRKDPTRLDDMLRQIIERERRH